MKKFITLASAAALSLAITVPSASAAPAPGLKLGPKTSEIFLYDGGLNEGGPQCPAVSVGAIGTNLPAGWYQYDLQLVQDGVTASYAYGSALGWAEPFWYDGSEKKRAFSHQVYSPQLHPGTATATFSVVWESQDGTTGGSVSDTRVVRIPSTGATGGVCELQFG